MQYYVTVDLNSIMVQWLELDMLLLHRTSAMENISKFFQHCPPLRQACLWYSSSFMYIFVHAYGGFEVFCFVFCSLQFIFQLSLAEPHLLLRVITGKCILGRVENPSVYKQFHMNCKLYCYKHKYVRLCRVILLVLELNCHH